jgi:hypothetical protein
MYCLCLSCIYLFFITGHWLLNLHVP